MNSDYLNFLIRAHHLHRIFCCCFFFELMNVYNDYYCTVPMCIMILLQLLFVPDSLFISHAILHSSVSKCVIIFIQ